MSLSKLTTPALYILNGSQGKGKSYLIKYIMYQLHKVFKYGLVFTQTAFDGNPFPYIDKAFVHPVYDEVKLSKLMRKQERCIERGIINEAFCIFDDMLSPQMLKSQKMTDLCTQLRHYHITVILSTQYCNKIPPLVRSNCMSVFIFDSDARANLEAIHDSYCQRMGTYNDFLKYIDKYLAEPYSFIFYDTTKCRDREDKLEDVYEVLQCPAKIPQFYIEFPEEIALKPKKGKSKK